jgi:hypothetical protein
MADREILALGALAIRSATEQELPMCVYRNSAIGLGVICVVMLLLALAPASAKAAFVIENDSVYGASSVVLDTSTGLYWLKPTETLGLTFSTVQADIAAGQTGNFAYASASQVQALLSDAGITDFSNGVSAPSYAGASAIISALGQTSGGTFTNGSYFGSYTQVAGLYAGNSEAYTIAYQLNASGAFGCASANCAETTVGNVPGNSIRPFGNWLVATSLDSGSAPPPVPIPASVWLMLSALVGLGSLGRRRSIQ